MVKTLPKRKDVKKEDQWNLEDFYKNDDEWLKDFKELSESYKKILKFKGKLSHSAETLANCIKELNEIERKTDNVYVYAFLKSDEDLSNSFYAGRLSQIKSLVAKISGEMSYIIPEIFKISNKTMDKFLKNDCIKPYSFFFEDILRLKPHILSEEEEKILALASEALGGAYNLFSTFNNGDLKFPIIKDETGEEVTITHGRYTSFLISNDRNVRKAAFENYYQVYKTYNNTFATMLENHIKSNVFKSSIRKFNSAIEHYLSDDNVPETVYDNLIKTVCNNLDALHKYMKLRKKVLGFDELHLYDVFVPLVNEYSRKFTFDEATEIVLKAIQPMGEEYVSIAKKAIEQRWIDKYENEGKNSGAYSSGSYDSYPYILMNFSGNINDVFTYVHEMGHSIHSYFSKANQPYIYSRYKAFVAEVASTFNEALLTNYLMKNATSKEEKMFLLNQEIEKIRGTLYRQAMFADFEKKIYNEVERGNSLTSDSLCEMYRELNKKWFGDDVFIDEQINYEWARIPHLYYNFYVYKYCIGISCATTLAEKVISGNKDIIPQYINNFLKAGSSNYPIEILKSAGVDISTPEPVEKTLKYFSKLVDELEKLFFNSTL